MGSSTTYLIDQFLFLFTNEFSIQRNCCYRFADCLENFEQKVVNNFWYWKYLIIYWYLMNQDWKFLKLVKLTLFVFAQFDLFILEKLGKINVRFKMSISITKYLWGVDLHFILNLDAISEQEYMRQLGHFKDKLNLLSSFDI